MPVDSVHPEYKKNQPFWKKCHDCYDGEEAVKAAATAYLPQLRGQDIEQYNAYKNRALFYGATGRTVDGIVGAIMRKEPQAKAPEIIEKYMEDITFTGVSLHELVKKLLTGLFVTAREGLLVDRLPDGAGDTRPYLTRYCAESIVNWATNDAGDLCLVVLQECYTERDPKDPYVLEEKIRYRELALEGGVYVQKVHTKTKSGSVEQWSVTTTNPTFRGKAMDYIPFVFVTPSGVSTEIEKPPVLDLVNVNLSHYRTSADLEHGRHFTALPTPWFSGVTKTDLGNAIYLGSGQAVVLPPPEAKAGFLEFSGSGLVSLKEALSEKEAMMASLGARLLEDRRKGVESAETARIHQAGEMSVSMSIAIAVSAALSKALNFMAKWEGSGDKSVVEIKLNTDFIQTTMEPSLIAELMKLWQAGGVSHDTLLFNLKRGELLPPGRTEEEERQLISAEEPAMTPPAPKAPGSEGDKGGSEDGDEA